MASVTINNDSNIITITFPKTCNLPSHPNRDLMITAEMKTMHFPRPVVFDFCPGKTRMPYGQWWVPEGKRPEECTICEYCVNQRCLGDVKLLPYYHASFNLSGNYIGEIPLDQLQNGNCDCDCPKRHQHPTPRNLFCPLCTITEKTCKYSNTCQQCGNEVHYKDVVYCPPCSHLAKACQRCGEKFKDGNTYIKEIVTFFTDEIKKSWLDQLGNNLDPYTLLKCRLHGERLQHQIEEVYLRYKDKSVDQVIAMS